MKTIFKYLTMLATCILMFAFYLIVINQGPTTRDYNCYISHVQECLDCHNLNLTYLLCSGFCVNLQSDDDEYYCRWGLNKSCWDLPKECNF